MRGSGATPCETLRGGLSPYRRQVLVPRPDYPTTGEIPRDHTHVGSTTIKVALWNVNGAPRKEEEKSEMMCKTNHTLADTMKSCIVLWCLGHYTQLRAEAKALQTPRSTHSISDEFQKAYNTRRANKLAEEGAYSKATQTLRSDGILPPSQEVTAALLGKHPKSPPVLMSITKSRRLCRHIYEFQRVRW